VGEIHPTSSSAIDADGADTGGIGDVGDDDDGEVELVGSGEIDSFSNPLISKPLYIVGKWKHPRTRDGRVSVLIVLPTGVLDRDDGVAAEVLDDTVTVTFTWPRVLVDANKLMGAILSFCKDMDIGQGTLLAQGLMDYTEPLQSREDDDIKSTCRIKLPFNVKPDFEQDILRFPGDNTTMLYLLRFSAPERKFALPTQRLAIRDIQKIDPKPASSVPEEGTVRSSTSAPRFSTVSS